MVQATPPHVVAALQQLKAAAKAIDGRDIEDLKTPWVEIEKSIIKLLGGAFQIDRPDHQALALGLAGIYAARLANDQQAFWFANREAIEGGALGFPEALLVVSPFGAVADALSRGNLARLDEMATEVRTSLGRARFSPGSAGAVPVRLRPEDFQRLFDPGFLQFIVLDSDKAKTTWQTNAVQVLKEIREAFARTGSKIPAEARQHFEARMISVLQKLQPDPPLVDQAGDAPRVFELVTYLFSGVDATGIAPEEFWQDVVLPLLFIGAPSEFPPIDPQDIAALDKGLDPLLLFVDLVPYQVSAPEDGLLGAFLQGDVSLLQPAMGPAGVVRLLKLNRDRLRPLLDSFQPDQTRLAVQKFTDYLQSRRSGPAGGAGARPSQLLDPSLKLLSDLKRCSSAAKGAIDLCVRHATEAEAALEGTVAELRRVVQGPRIILL